MKKVALALVIMALTLSGCGTKKKEGMRLKATPHSTTLSWSQAGTLTGNNIYRGATSGSETLLTSLTTPVTTYTDTAVTAGAPYCYEVTAVNSADSIPESAKSNEVCVTIPNPQPPAAPTGLTGTAQ